MLPMVLSRPDPARGIAATAVPGWCAGVRSRIAIVGLAAAVVLLTNLGSAPLWDDDEPKNTACSVTMLARRDWVVPWFNGELRVAKPPLVNWIQFGGFALLGPDEAGARLGSALATIATSLLVAGIAARLFPTLPLVGVWSGLAMATCVWSAVAGRAATPDAALCACTTLALWIFVAASFRTGNTAAHGEMRLGTGAALACGAALGGAVLAKGPVGIVLPLSAFGVFAWWQAFATGTVAGGRERAAWSARGFVVGAARAGAAIAAALRQLRPVLVVAAAVAVAGPWHVLVWQRTDGAWVREFLLRHNVDRFATPLEGHGGPPFYYIIVLVIGLFPWSIVAAVTAADVVNGLRRDREAAPLRLLAAWAAVWIGCFSLAGTKLPGYVWPAYPAAAIATGWFLERWRLGRTPAFDRWMPVGWAVLAVAGLALAIGLPLATGGLSGESAWLGLVGAVPVATAALAWGCAARERRGAALGWLAAGGCLTVTLLAAVGPDVVGRDSGARPLVRSTETASTWATYRCTLPGLVYYSGAAARDERIEGFAHLAPVREFFAAHPDGRIVAPAAAAADVLAVAPAGHAVIGRARSLTRHRELVVVGGLPTASRH